MPSPLATAIMPMLDASEPFWEKAATRYIAILIGYVLEVAIEEGANLIRVGTAIFGYRDYRSEEK